MENEKRLIDADALLAKITEENPMVHFGPFGYCGCSPNSDFGEKVFMRDRVLEIVESAPTVDAVEVVRCEKCLYRSQYPDENGDYKCGGLLTEDEELLLMVKPDFFCAYGERRDKDAVD